MMFMAVIWAMMNYFAFHGPASKLCARSKKFEGTAWPH